MEWTGDWNGLWTRVDGYIAHVRDVHSRSPHVYLSAVAVIVSPFFCR